MNSPKIFMAVYSGWEFNHEFMALETTEQGARDLIRDAWEELRARFPRENFYEWEQIENDVIVTALRIGEAVQTI